MCKNLPKRPCTGSALLSTQGTVPRQPDCGCQPPGSFLSDLCSCGYSQGVTLLSSVKAGSAGCQGLSLLSSGLSVAFPRTSCLCPPSCPALSTEGSHWQGAEDHPVGLEHDSGRSGGLGCRSGHQIFSLVPLDTHVVWPFFPSNSMTVLRPLTRAPVSPFPEAKWRVIPADRTGFLILTRMGGHKHGA